LFISKTIKNPFEFFTIGRNNFRTRVFDKATFARKEFAATPLSAVVVDAKTVLITIPEPYFNPFARELADIAISAFRTEKHSKGLRAALEEIYATYKERGREAVAENLARIKAKPDQFLAPKTKPPVKIKARPPVRKTSSKKAAAPKKAKPPTQKAPAKKKKPAAPKPPKTPKPPRLSKEDKIITAKEAYAVCDTEVRDLAQKAKDLKTQDRQTARRLLSFAELVIAAGPSLNGGEVVVRKAANIMLASPSLNSHARPVQDLVLKTVRSEEEPEAIGQRIDFLSSVICNGCPTELKAPTLDTYLRTLKGAKNYHIRMVALIEITTPREPSAINLYAPLLAASASSEKTAPLARSLVDILYLDRDFTGFYREMLPHAQSAFDSLQAGQTKAFLAKRNYIDPRPQAFRSRLSRARQAMHELRIEIHSPSLALGFANEIARLLNSHSELSNHLWKELGVDYTVSRKLIVDTVDILDEEWGMTSSTPKLHSLLKAKLEAREQVAS